MQEIREERSGSNFHTTDALSFEFPTIKKVLDKSRAAIHDSASYYKPCHVSIGPRHRCSSNLLREAKKREWLGRLKAAANERPEVQVRYWSLSHCDFILGFIIYYPTKPVTACRFWTGTY